MKYDGKLEIAVADTSRAASWQNKRSTWEAIAVTLKDTERTSETIKQYLSYSRDKQGSIKDVGGFVGGYLKEGRRKKGHVVYRQIVALDVDFGAMGIWEGFTMLEAAGLVYSTHKHTPADPRLRIVFPLDRKVNADEYEAIARIVASWLGIDAFDDTTYQPTRLMYYPSTAKDGEYVYDIVDAPFMCADDVLADLPNWEDPTTWPVSSRVKTAVKEGHGSKVEDPTLKEGIIGAFCRAYGIAGAIAEFLPDHYAPADHLGPDRYTFAGGTTSGGLVVYDDKTAYSHHSTDPSGGKLCNAFDLVRLHKFGDLDEKAKPGGVLPSFKAMADFASKLKEVKREIIASRKSSVDEYDDLEGEARAIAFNEDWIDELETTAKGDVKNTINNVFLILQNDEYLSARFGYNEFEQRETAVTALPWDKGVLKYPRPLADHDDAELRLYLEKAYGITGKGQITDALTVAVRANSYHPVREYLDGVDWDGVARLDGLFINLFGAPDTAYTKAVTRKSFCAAVMRIYKPGIKYDHVLVIVGDQGIGKSTTIDKMGGPWFSDSLTTMEGKDAVEAIQGAWLIELGELAGMRKDKVDQVKHFVSKREDRFRVAYGKRVEHFPRRCVFFGTTNEEDFLRDVTGNRRFWVVNAKGGRPREDFKTYLTPEMVNQLWGEAKTYALADEPLYLHTEELEADARLIQDKHLEKDERVGIVSEYLSRGLPNNWDSLDTYQRRQWLADQNNEGPVVRAQVCTLEIWAECLEKDANSITRRDSFEIGRILKSVPGWGANGKTDRYKMYGVQKVYENFNLK